MKPTVFPQACLVLLIGVLAGCDATTSPDGKAMEVYSQTGATSSSTPAYFQYSGSWSISDPGTTSGALVGIWKGIFAYSQSRTSYRDTVEITLYSGGQLYWTRYYSESDPVYGDFNSSQSSSGTWSATASQLTTTMYGVTTTGAYSLNGNALTIVDAQWTPTSQTFQRQ